MEARPLCCVWGQCLCQHMVSGTCEGCKGFFKVLGCPGCSFMRSGAGSLTPAGFVMASLGFSFQQVCSLEEGMLWPLWACPRSRNLDLSC